MRTCYITEMEWMVCPRVTRWTVSNQMCAVSTDPWSCTVELGLIRLSIMAARRSKICQTTVYRSGKQFQHYEDLSEVQTVVSRDTARADNFLLQRCLPQPGVTQMPRALTGSIHLRARDRGGQRSRIRWGRESRREWPPRGLHGASL